MDERPRRQFDLVRAAFLLVAGIMAIYALTLLIALGACILYGMAQGVPVCKEGQLGELLATLLATAVAFAGGMMRQGPPPPSPPADR